MYCTLDIGILTLVYFIKYAMRFEQVVQRLGTLRQLCGLLGRHPAAKDPKKEMNACVDFLMAIVKKGHYNIAAACSTLGIKDPHAVRYCQ